MSQSQNISQELRAVANPKKIPDLARFFKTGPGEYGEGDKFLGITVPEQRKIAKKNEDIKIPELAPLLTSEYHEERLTAFLILTYKFKKAEKEKNQSLMQQIYTFYLKHKSWVNNWDIVDVTTPHIVGRYMWLNPKEQRKLNKLAQSKSLWDRRISIMATQAFIRENSFEKTLEIAEILVNDPEDLIQKAVGWMLRELGNKDQAKEEEFLEKHHKTMPRTMLRYAIEKFDPSLRNYYMAR